MILRFRTLCWYIIALSFCVIFVLVQGSVLPTSADLPPLRQNHARILTTINGIWDNCPHAWCVEKQRLLSEILLNYVHACEVGFEVHVVLIMYENPNTSFALLPPGQLMCDRVGTSLPVVVDRYRHEPLPNGTFGTGGTLAQKHRLLFYQKRNAGYDVFINQEDDMLVKAHHIAYFVANAKQTPRTGWYPGFTRMESLAKFHNRTYLYRHPSMFVGWRIQDIEMHMVEGRIWVKQLAHQGTGVYMITVEMLQNMTSQGWEKQVHPGGEFNPYYGSDWLHAHFTVGMPLSVVVKGVRHAPDKYINMAMHNKHGMLGINVKQLEHVLYKCVGERQKHEKKPARLFIYPDGDPYPCKSCLDKKKHARLRIQTTTNTTLYYTTSFVDSLNVTVTCG